MLKGDMSFRQSNSSRAGHWVEGGVYPVSAQEGRRGEGEGER